MAGSKINGSFERRATLEKLLEMAHDLKHIQEFAIREARLRTKKNKLFLKVFKEVDELYKSELLKRRKDDK